MWRTLYLFIFKFQVTDLSSHTTRTTLATTAVPGAVRRSVQRTNPPTGCLRRQITHTQTFIITATITEATGNLYSQCLQTKLRYCRFNKLLKLTNKNSIYLY